MPQRCLEQGFVRAVICRNAAPGQATASSCTQHLPPGQAAASSCTQHLRPRPGDSLIWRRYGGGVSNRCRWADRFAMSEQQQSCGHMQSMERHFQRSRELFRTDRGRPCPREWKDPQAKRCGRMERSGSLCGRGYRSAGCRRAEAAAREMLQRKPLRQHREATASGSADAKGYREAAAGKEAFPSREGTRQYREAATGREGARQHREETPSREEAKMSMGSAQRASA